jgi:23S rRNA pseudouridine2605 synthase
MSEYDSSNSTGDRLQKIIAQAGLASRRDAEELIRECKVTVNGKTASLGDKATLGKDAIKVRGKLIHSTEQKVYYIIYKPKNVISSMLEDDEGRSTLKEFTKRIPERVFTVGKMDFTGEGAILLTNDGEIAQRLQKTNDIIRRFHVKVDRHPTNPELEKLARGGRIDGRSMNPVHVRLANAYAKNALIEISFEGMNAIDIRKFFENKGFYPERIATVGIGHIMADKMLPGTIKKIEGSSVQALFGQPELAKKLIEKLVAKKSHVKTLEKADAKEAEAVEDRATRTERKSFAGSAGGIQVRPVGANIRAAGGDREERAERPARAAFGERKPFGERKAFGEKSSRPAGRPTFGERKTFGERNTRPARDGARSGTRPAGRPSFAGVNTSNARSGGPARPTIRAKRA